MNDRTYPTRPQLQLILDQGQFDRQVWGNFMEPRIFGPGGSALKNFRKFPVG